MLSMSSPSPRPPGQSSLDEYPEISFTADWGSLVRRKRVEMKLSQDELSDRVGCEQALLSMIENGRVLSSKAVVPLVRELDIPPPRQFLGDELDERWHDAGRVLRRVNLSVFKALLTSAEQAIAESEPDPS